MSASKRPAPQSPSPPVGEGPGARAKNPKNKGKPVGAVLVVGGGIAGMQASLDLAESGFRVHLLDVSPCIGGTMAQLDKTFPTNDCAMCIMAPKLVESGRHLNIRVTTNAELAELRGEPGSFEAKIVRHPRYIDVEKCTGCGECSRYCPVHAISRFNEGLSQRRAVYIDYPQAVPLAYSIDREKCVGCSFCQNVCLADAVVYDDEERVETLSVGAVVLTPGFEEFPAALKSEYGYGVYDNVVTSIEFERILSASGPYKGHVQRPSEGDFPQKVAFVQCVGSRDRKVGKDYCSGVCCMYATKEAVIAKEHAGEGLETTIFMMDMRAHGKDFDAYYERASGEHGVRYVRSRVSAVQEIPETKNLLISYETEGGDIVKEEFDLVVLSVGLSVPERVRQLGEAVGIDLNKYDFCQTETLQPMRTSRPGVFVAGVFQGPKDIPESVTQASGAAAEASSLLHEARGTLWEEKEYPAEQDVEGEEPRIGAFICHCGINIGGFLDVPEVVEYAKALPGVVYAEHNLYTCSQDTQDKIVETIKEHGLNRVIVASCTPRTHEPLFQETIRAAGLNPHLFEMANIRDQCSWIHMQLPEQGSRKAKDLVRMAVAKARLIEPLKALPLEVNQSALVIGGGLAGLVAGLTFAEEGYPVYLVEREKELGGNLRKIHYTLEGVDVQSYLADLIAQVEGNPNTTVLLNREVQEISGFVGNYKTTLKDDEGKTEEIEHGVVVVAIGGEEHVPKEYLYGDDPRVLTQRQFEDKLSDPSFDARLLKNVVMIQCVGSRDDERDYCSKICCAAAVKNAGKLLEQNPEANVYVAYRDVRTYGFKESYYEDVREKGAVFLRYEPDNKPEVVAGSTGLEVRVWEPLLKEKLALPADLVVLSTGIVPRPESEELSKILKCSRATTGFFLEAHVKLRPVDFATEGVFLAGLAHGPKSIEETIAQAKAAVSRACTIISKPTYMAEATIAAVNEDICDGCGICEPVCEYKAIEIVVEKVGEEEKKKAKITEALCKGCGGCVAACPAGAMEQKGFKSDQMLAVIDTCLDYWGGESVEEPGEKPEKVEVSA
jgi:heterodisulfide reductase subunit A